MARDYSWRQLRLGVVAATILTTLVLYILIFARVGAMRGDKSTLHVLAADATDIMPGTEVWLSGEKVGLVKRVHFRPVSTDTLRRISIETEILTRSMPFIRRDAWADIRPGANPIGTPVVFISSGTAAARPLVSGDSIVVISVSAMKPVGERVATLGARLGALADTTARVVTLLGSEVGALGAAANEGIPRIAAATTSLSNLAEQATRGPGTIGLAARGDIGARLARISAAKDSITALLASDSGSYGRFRRDSTLTRAVAGLSGTLDSLKATFAGGGVGRLQSDTALKAELARIGMEMSALMADLRKNPRKYLPF